MKIINLQQWLLININKQPNTWLNDRFIIQRNSECQGNMKDDIRKVQGSIILEDRASKSNVSTKYEGDVLKGVYVNIFG